MARSLDLLTGEALRSLRNYGIGEFVALTTLRNGINRVIVLVLTALKWRPRDG